MSKKHLDLIQIIGSALVLLGVVLKFNQFVNAKYIFSAGVFVLFVLQILYAQKTKKASVRYKRIMSLMFIATVFLGVGAYFMFVGNDNWIVAVILYAFITLFLSFRGKKE